MEAIRKNVLISSETLTIPELKKFIGKNVEIIFIEEDKEKKKRSGIKKNIKFMNAIGKICIDEEKVNNLREVSKI